MLSIGAVYARLVRNLWTTSFFIFHCTYASSLWSFLVCLFGVSWVMPKQAVEALACWKGVSGVARLQIIEGYSVLSYVDYSERVESSHFLGEHSILDLKRFFLGSLYDWMRGT